MKVIPQKLEGGTTVSTVLTELAARQTDRRTDGRTNGRVVAYSAL